MNVAQWPVEATAKSLADIFSGLGLDVGALPAFVRLQLTGAAAPVYWGASNVTNAPANSGGFVAGGTTETLVAVEPNTIQSATLFLVGTDGVLHITVG